MPSACAARKAAPATRTTSSSTTACFNRIGLAVEVKLCKDKDREKDIIGEINDDVIGYAGRYDRCLFVIYDLGFIRDTEQFSRDIEGNPNIHVLIVKK